MSHSKSKLLIIQLFLYFWVGAVCCCIDLGVFACLSWLELLPLVLASALSFILATLINYLLSFKFVFDGGNLPRINQIARLFLVSLIGLAINSLFFWALLVNSAMTPVLAKFIAIGATFFWNFWGRKKFVYA
ncbi:MAG TPA: GtrA family protein [Chlamydiales bacterium]|nr:GtrA family protein [Chlamydiales bacterium]